MPEEEHRQLHAEILRLKKERNAYILAHNYAPKDIQDIADAVGDSLYLAQRGAASDADILLEASVLFMNQILAIMKKPHQRVLAPDLGALCSPYHVERQRQLYPDAAVVVHPECGCTSACMRQMAQGTAPAHMMQFRSTQGMVQFVRDTPQKVVIMATEVGNIHPLSKAAPGKTIVPANPEAVCAYMKQNTFRKLYLSLRDGVHEIEVDAELAARARLPIERMLSIV